MACAPAGGGIEGRAQNIAPLQVGGIVAIDAIDAIDAIEDMGFWGCGLGGMEENKRM